MRPLSFTHRRHPRWLGSNSKPTASTTSRFRYAGQKFKKSLRTRDEQNAAARLHRVDENIMLVECGRLIVPDEVDLGAFLLSDGRLNGKEVTAAKKTTAYTAGVFDSIHDIDS